MNVFVDCQQKISTDKSKQTSTLLENRNLNESCFEMPESSFEHLLTIILSLSINWLLKI